MLRFKDCATARFFVCLFVQTLFSVGRCKWRGLKAQKAVDFPQESLLQCKSKLRAPLGPMQSPSLGVGGLRDTNPSQRLQRRVMEVQNSVRLHNYKSQQAPRPRSLAVPGFSEQSLLGNVVPVVPARPTGKWLGGVGEGVDAREVKGKWAAGVWAGVPRAETPLSFGFGFGSGDCRCCWGSGPRDFSSDPREHN